MRSHRFYISLDPIPNTEFLLPKEVSHHCLQVLRCQSGDPLILFNGDGKDYLATLIGPEGKLARVKLESIEPNHAESALKIHLYQGVARGEKMDLIIQKAVELGVDAITPVFSERSNVKLDPKRLSRKLEHWQGIIISACEQSGRATLPQLHNPLGLHQVELPTEVNAVYLEPTAGQSFQQLTPALQLALFIGPEGGFSERDLQQLVLLGAQGVRLGPRILRTETAGLVAIALAQSYFGDLQS